MRIECSTRLCRLRNALQGSDDGNLPFLLGGLLEKTVEASLRLNCRWYLDTGHGIRDLQVAFPSLADELVSAIKQIDRAEAYGMLAAYLTKLFGERLPIEEWDSGWVEHPAGRS